MSLVGPKQALIAQQEIHYGLEGCRQIYSLVCHQIRTPSREPKAVRKEKDSALRPAYSRIMGWNSNITISGVHLLDLSGPPGELHGFLKGTWATNHYVLIPEVFDGINVMLSSAFKQYPNTLCRFCIGSSSRTTCKVNIDISVKI